MAEQLRHVLSVTGGRDLTDEEYHKLARAEHSKRLKVWAGEWEKRCCALGVTSATAPIKPQLPLSEWCLPDTVDDAKPLFLVLSATSIMKGLKWQLVGKDKRLKDDKSVEGIANTVQRMLATRLESGQPCVVLVACCYGRPFVQALEKVVKPSGCKHLVTFFWEREVPTDRVLQAVYAMLNGPKGDPEGLYKHVQAYLSESFKFWADPMEDGVEPIDSPVSWSATFRSRTGGQEFTN